jgi:hypothetical protein
LRVWYSVSAICAKRCVYTSYCLLHSTIPVLYVLMTSAVSVLTALSTVKDVSVLSAVLYCTVSGEELRLNVKILLTRQRKGMSFFYRKNLIAYKGILTQIENGLNIRKDMHMH